MLNEDYIKDLFNHRDDESQDWFDSSDQTEDWVNPIDENQDWLEPSDALLENIEEVIYHKPRRSGFFWTILGFTLVFIFSSYSWFSLQGNGSNNYSSILLSNVFSSPQAIQFTKTTNKQNTSTKQLFSEGQAPLDYNSDLVSKEAANDHITLEKKINVKRKANYKTQKVVLDNSKKSKINFDDKQISMVAPINRLVSNNRSHAILKDEEAGVLASKKQDLLSDSKIKSLDPLMILPLSFDEEASFNVDDITPYLYDKRNHAFSFGFAYTFWNFTLNQNYLAALSPADFSYQQGRGYQMHVAYDKKIAHRLSWVTSLSLEKITYESGHNSSVNYELANEDLNLQNRFSLNMASPLGFLGSEVTVQRLNQDLTQNQNDLVLDLHNSHKNYNVDINSAIAFNFIDRNRFKAAFQMGLGFNHLFGLQNELTQVNITETDFKSVSTSITSNQENIFASRPYANIGMRLNKSINRNFALTLEYGYKKDLRAIYSNADFSTRLSRHLLQSSVRYSF